LHQAGAFFVTRAKRGMDARRVYSNPADRSTGLICDQLVMLTGYYPVRNYPEHRGASSSRIPSLAKRWCS